MNEEAMRKAFEALCEKRWRGDRGALVMRADGEYENGNVQFGWVCYQAATRAAVPAWQPIDTAPKDVLVDILVEGRRYAGCHWDKICGEFRHITACGVLICLRNASHWMQITHASEVNT